MADLPIAGAPSPSEAVPGRFWLSEAIPQPWQDAWERWFPRCEDDYRTVTLPYLATGEQPEYVPPYMRQRAPAGRLNSPWYAPSAGR